MLTRGPNSEDSDGNEIWAKRGWYRNYPQCKNREDDQDCDEYPFYSTKQGGPASGENPTGDLKLINSTDNRRQGSALNVFYQGCSVTNGVSFLVLPIESNVVPTFGYCVGP